MTKQVGLFMKDYREIDRLIAEKVMGYEKTKSIWYDDLDKSKTYYAKVYDDLHVIEYDGDEWIQYLFSPSTNIADAWQVADKLKIAIIPQSEGAPEHLKYLAIFDPGRYDNRPIEMFAETAPLAICLAALKAVGIDVDEVMVNDDK